MPKRVGRWTLHFASRPRFLSAVTNVGPKEGAGPLGQHFDMVQTDAMRGLRSAEAAERQFMQEACDKALTDAKVTADAVDLFTAGDLLNQIVTANFVARAIQAPFIGVYNACATIGDALAVAAMALDGDFTTNTLVSVSSHYQTAERQFRYPIELNVQRKQTNQWTVTGAAAAVLGREGPGPKITHATLGRVVDYGLKDPNDMGAAMAPAAVDTFLRHLADMNATVADYDLIITGDLATCGKSMFAQLVKEAGISLGNKHQDAGSLIFNAQQNVKAGGSGAACLAVVLFGYIMKEMARGHWRRVLVIPTGALYSPISFQQGESIPCIAHAFVIES